MLYFVAMYNFWQILIFFTSFNVGINEKKYNFTHSVKKNICKKFQMKSYCLIIYSTVTDPILSVVPPQNSVIMAPSVQEVKIYLRFEI